MERTRNNFRTILPHQLLERQASESAKAASSSARRIDYEVERRSKKWELSRARLGIVLNSVSGIM